MAAGRRDIEIIVGDDYTHVVNIQTRTGPIDITGRTYTAQIRKAAYQPIIASFTCTVTDAVNGEVTITMSDAVTALLVHDTYRWDLQQDAAGVRNTILRGKCRVSADTTR